jgi:fructosamine-3-kinase
MIHHEQRPALVHGDFHPKHILVDEDGNISGLVDFEACRGGDLIYDLAAWDYLQRDLFPLGWLLGGYQRHTTVPDDWPVRLGVYRVVLGLFYILIAGGRMPRWAQLGNRYLPGDTAALEGL